MKLTDGVYSFPQHMGEKKIHPIGIETEDGLILVDTGMSDQTDVLEEELSKEGFEFNDVEKIVLTHQDPDHCGALSEVAERSGATVLAHENDVPAISGKEDPIKAEQRYPEVKIDIELTGGEKLNSKAGKIEVHTTPGHTPGHISLVVGDLLIAGDAVTSAEGKLAGPWEEFTPEISQAYESVFYLSTLEFTETHCFHGGHVKEGAKELTDVFESYRDNLEAFTAEQVEKTAFLRRELGTEKVGLSSFELPSGEKHGARDDPEKGHFHTRQEEIYLFIEGSGTMKIDNKNIEYEEGTAVRVKPYALRRIDAEEDTRFIVAGAPIKGDEAGYRDL
ncbi:MBL fold metallo-hydrolase [Candidatus Nanohalococcus occultus]|uniref:MBL fold metallo-hydrolase n=1 Tax=Candidatus Nanohalococcus occultus TaxID=2978047 RepID=UPI0039DFE7D6